MEIDKILQDLNQGSKTKDKDQASKLENSTNDNQDTYKLVQCKSKRSTGEFSAYGTGRRKSSIARVWVKPGNGKILVNRKHYKEYFPCNATVDNLLKPFVVTNTVGKFDVICSAKGGGSTGQVDAIIHGVARALDCISEDYHSILRKKGLLTRDSRVVERKKYGKHKARKSTQFSKR